MIIAMWSGPRNLSTAMMRSFGARADCTVWDEPFYAAYLARTGSPHPMTAEIIAAYETDPEIVARRCLLPGERALHYQKHMTHHMLEGVPRAWIGEVCNVFLIRAPERVIASYHAKREQPELAELGFTQQAELFDQVTQMQGAPPPVIDAADIRRDPAGMLRALCGAIGIAFDPAMLAWPAGERAEDGIWGRHWYRSVWQSTGFAPPEAPSYTPLTGRLAEIAAAAEPSYRLLAKHRLKSAGD